MSGGLPNPLSTKDLQPKTGRDLRVARTLLEISQGQLAYQCKLKRENICDWEATERDIPEWGVAALSEVVAWPSADTIREQLGRTFLVSITGMTKWQMQQKIKGIGRFVDGVVEVVELGE